jgi:hypothetical protein
VSDGDANGDADRDADRDADGYAHDYADRDAVEVDDMLIPLLPKDDLAQTREFAPFGRELALCVLASAVTDDHAPLRQHKVTLGALPYQCRSLVLDD